MYHLYTSFQNIILFRFQTQLQFTNTSKIIHITRHKQQGNKRNKGCHLFASTFHESLGIQIKPADCFINSKE